MRLNIERCALIQWLGEKAPHYATKALELRGEIEGWLTYIPHTFPHYTRHTVDHSDEIIMQVSNLLFYGGSPVHPALPDLSGVEAYIVVAAAYLHDSGMVVSDREKAAILVSTAWKKWISETEQRQRYEEIERFRESAVPPDATARHFLADIQLRFLIAEFVRRQHHHRAANVIEAHEQGLGRFAFNDPRLKGVISNVCVGHGLSRHQLEDVDRYPEEVDLLGEKANIKMCALLLRLGDLLDLRTSRACPLLLDAACPLPTDSTSHWSQYISILKTNTAPDRIEINAACRSPDEHRKLRDWCRWIEDEATNASLVMRNARRHSAWRPPVARMGSRSDSSATIRIAPAPDAKYKDMDWKFQLDEAEVFDRLIRDTYSSEWDFVRELLQNAIDASRCKMSMDLVAQSCDPPEDPRSVPYEIRSKYPVTVRLQHASIINDYTGQEERRPVVVIEDAGIGMNTDIVQKYLLQIGHSWYESPAFAEQFRFTASSKFGLGFLSVFAISSNVEIETLRAGPGQTPLRLIVTGPRSYILVENGNRSTPGTRISVQLTKELARPLHKIVDAWCKRVEFPIIVQEGDERIVIDAEESSQVLGRLGPQTPAWTVRSSTVDNNGIKGDLYWMVSLDRGVETWGTTPYDVRKHQDALPTDTLPDLPDKLICFGGVTVLDQREPHSADECFRVDCRRRGLRPVLSRNFLQSSSYDEIRATVNRRWEELLTEHLSKLPKPTDLEEWKYRQHLARSFRLESFWRNVKGMIPTYTGTDYTPLSFQEASEKPEIWFMTTTAQFSYEQPTSRGSDLEGHRVFVHDTHWLCEPHQELFAGRGIKAIRFGAESQVAVKWALDSCSSLPAGDGYLGNLVVGLHALALPDGLPFVVQMNATAQYHSWLILNESHPLGMWCARMIRKEWSKADHPLDEQAKDRLLRRLLGLFDSSPQREAFDRFLDAWDDLEGLADDLRPPKFRVSTRV